MWQHGLRVDDLARTRGRLAPASDRRFGKGNGAVWNSFRQTSVATDLRQAKSFRITNGTVGNKPIAFRLIALYKPAFVQSPRGDFPNEQSAAYRCRCRDPGSDYRLDLYPQR